MPRVETSKVVGLRLLTSLFSLVVLGLTAVSAHDASASSKVVQATKTRGVQQIGDLRIQRGYNATTLLDASAVFGTPARIRRPYPEVCQAFFGRGLRLDFVSYGLESRCNYRYLQAGLVKSRAWTVKVGSRSYRVGMPKRRIPKKAKFQKFYGYQLATKPFIGRKTGTVFAQVGSKGRIRAFYLFIGLAGD